MRVNSSNRANQATETFDRLQRKTAIPIVLAVATVVIVVNGSSIWLLPVIGVVAAIYVFTVVAGTRLVRRRLVRLRGTDRK